MVAGGIKRGNLTKEIGLNGQSYVVDPAAEVAKTFGRNRTGPSFKMGCPPPSHEALRMPLLVNDSIADLATRLGGIPPQRIRLTPPPGTATMADAIDAAGRGELVELIDGTLVDKAMGWEESTLAAVLIRLLGNFLELHDLGRVAAPDGIVEILQDQTRGPDVAFYDWAALAARSGSRAVPRLTPYLAIEVLSSTNTRAEMRRKRREYFDAKVTAVWIVDPKDRTITTYRDPDTSQTYGVGQIVPGPGILADWGVEVARLFAELDRTGPRVDR